MNKLFYIHCAEQDGSSEMFLYKNNKEQTQRDEMIIGDLWNISAKINMKNLDTDLKNQL